MTQIGESPVSGRERERLEALDQASSDVRRRLMEVLDSIPRGPNQWSVIATSLADVLGRLAVLQGKTKLIDLVSAAAHGNFQIHLERAAQEAARAVKN